VTVRFYLALILRSNVVLGGLSNYSGQVLNFLIFEIDLKLWKLSTLEAWVGGWAGGWMEINQVSNSFIDFVVTWGGRELA